jgi:cytochrome c biogenesis protein
MGTSSSSLRQTWREFRSMRTALVLLLALATAAIFGSLFPQQNISPQRVQQYASDHPALAQVLDRLGMFDVFGAPWFMAIYLALLTALVACLVPRITSYLRLLHARPHPPRSRLDRYHSYSAFHTSASPEQAVDLARRTLGRRRFRLAAHGTGELSAEKGYLREAGSLLFHVSFLLLLVGLAYGKGFGYRGQATVIEGETWADARINYDAFSPGRYFSADDLPPFSLRLDDFSNTFHADLTPKEYASHLVALDSAGRQTQAQKVTVNHPMTVDGVRVFQSDYGYAPVVRIRGPSGELLQDGPVLSNRDPSSEVSTGAVRLPSLKPQVGLQLTFFTGLRVVPGASGAQEIVNDPRLVNPVLVVVPFQGDLKASQAHSVFSLDYSGLGPPGKPLILPVGRSGRFPNGVTVDFPALKQYTILTLARDPGVPIVGAAAALILLGLIPSLYVTRRRVWLRAAAAAGGGARVELAGLALQGKIAFVDEFRDLARDLELALAPTGRAPDGEAPDGEAPLGSPAADSGITLDRTTASRASGPGE